MATWALAVGCASGACADPVRGIVARSYRYSNILLGGGEVFTVDRTTATIDRSEETGRTTYSVDARGGANLVGFDLASIPDSLTSPDRVDQVTLVDLASGTFAKFQRGSRSELRYRFDPAHLTTCDPDPLGTAAMIKPSAQHEFKFAGTDHIAGRVARHYRAVSPVAASMTVLASMARDLVGADSTTAVHLVSDAWTCAPDPVLSRWVEAKERFPELDEMSGFKRGEYRPELCRKALPPLADVLGHEALEDTREILVATDLSVEVAPSPAHPRAGAPRADEMPIALRGRSLYFARQRLLSLDEEPIPADALAAPRGYRVIDVPTAAGSGTRPAARPAPAPGERARH
jgi:hypothetical protein